MMLASHKQQERGRKVAEDSSLQAKTKKKDAKWLRKLGMSNDQSEVTRPSEVTKSDGAEEGGTPGQSDRSPFRRAKTTVLRAFGESFAPAAASPEAGLPPSPQSQAPTSPSPAVDESSGADSMLIEAIEVTLKVATGVAHDDPEEARRRKLVARFHATTAGPGQGAAQASTDPVATDSMASVVPRSAIRNLNLQLKQGRVYAVVGQPACGKSYLLRLLAKATHPSSGEIFVPPHLSTQHVEAAPELFPRLSLYENLLIRCGPDRGLWPSVEGVCELCANVGLPARWLEYIVASANGTAAAAAANVASGGGASGARPQNAELAAEVVTDEGRGAEATIFDDSASAWARQLSASERHQLQLCAALVANPNLLVLHKPTMPYQSTTAARVLDTVRRFVDDRGTGGILHGRQGMLARTVLLSCSADDAQALEIADDVIVMGLPNGGATLFDAAMLLGSGTYGSGASGGRTRGAALSQKVAELLPRDTNAVAADTLSQIRANRNSSNGAGMGSVSFAGADADSGGQSPSLAAGAYRKSWGGSKTMM